MTEQHNQESDAMALPASPSLLQGGLEECVAAPVLLTRVPGDSKTIRNESEAALPKPNDGKGSRLLVLDGLRATAICLVMIHHYSQGFRRGGFGDRFFYGFANSCWIGVDLFFVLSGFLITGILFEAKGSPSFFSTFYIRRSLRIFPIYYVMLLFIFVILPAFGQNIVGPLTLSNGNWFWLYGSNYLTGFTDWPDMGVVHLWSLAIEEHFYLVWPVIVFFATKRQLLIGGTAYMVIAMLMRYYAATHGTSSTAIYVMTHFRVDTLVIGGLLALGWKTPEIRATLVRHAGKAAVLVAVIIAIAGLGETGLDWPTWTPAQQAVLYTLIALFFVALHVVCLKLQPGSIFYGLLTCAPALWLGRLSYGMYLFHRPIEVLAIHLGLHPSEHVKHGFPSWIYALVYIFGNAAATALMAWLTWNLFEKHVLRLKDRFIYQKSKA